MADRLGLLVMGGSDLPRDRSLLSVCSENPLTKAVITREEKRLEDYIEDWYYGEEMNKFAKALGRYLLQFIDHLREQDISQKTRRKHMDNCWYIGYLECNFGYRDEFVPEEVFYSPDAPYDYEFKRKFFSSKSAMTAYRATWRKLYTYTRALGHLDGAERDSS
jgi:hypothetical protein